MAPLSGVLGKVADKTSMSAVVVLAGSHALVSMLLILAMALPWFSVSTELPANPFINAATTSISFSGNLFEGATDGAAAMLLLSFFAVVAIAGFCISASVAPINAKFYKSLVPVSGSATVFLLLSLVLAFTAPSGVPPSSRVSVLRFGAGTFFALVALLMQLVLGLLLHDFSSSASSAAPSTVSTAVATPVAGQASAGAKV
jgi:hypothetical protein